jgi:HD domain
VPALAPASDLIRGFTPETDLERRIATDPLVLRGFAWGKPRTGHPEGAVGNHVADLLETIDAWGEQEPRRGELRLVALLHDALKYKVHEWLPHQGPNHHAHRARRLAERYLDDERLLATIELHDRPYSLWKRMRRQGAPDERAFGQMLERVPDHGLFLRFVEIDGSTEGKDPEPIAWLSGELTRRGLTP